MSIQYRVQDLFSINAIRLCQFVEIFQYSFLNLVIVIFAVFILNSFILNKNYDHLLQNKENKNLHITKLFFILFIQTFFIIIIIFYIQKLVLVVPSIPHLLYPSFVPHTTSEISLHIALIYVFLELLPIYKENIDTLGKLLTI